MEEVKCYMPQTLAEALQIRKETGAQPLAGGSDLMVATAAARVSCRALRSRS